MGDVFVIAEDCCEWVGHLRGVNAAAKHDRTTSVETDEFLGICQFRGKCADDAVGLPVERIGKVVIGRMDATNAHVNFRMRGCVSKDA